MIKRYSLIGASVLIVGLSTQAFAVQSDGSQVTHRATHRHHLAKNATASPNTASDVDRDAGMYVVKPQSDPEYFGHGSGSDGSMPQ